MKKLLITGQNSYIGTSFEQWVKEKCPEEISIDFLNLRESKWQEKSLSGYDSIFHVAGIAHVDAKKISREEQEIYYKVNRDLTVELATKAKAEGVKQFIFMSSIIIYGKLEHITRNTQPAPENFYGDSKLQADLALQKISDKNFKVSIIRSPMVYGKSCKGNYRLLSFIARHAPFFPDYENKISMIYIENLCALIEKIILKEAEGIFFPQNSEYVNTSNMVREIAKSYGHKILISKKLNWLIKIGAKIPGPIQKKIHKAFRNMTYEKNLSKYEFEYRLVNFEDSIKKISS